MNPTDYLSFPLPNGFEFVRDTISYRPFRHIDVFVRLNQRLFRIDFQKTNNNIHDFDEACVVSAFDKNTCKWNGFIDKSYVESIAGVTFNGKEEIEDIRRFFDSAILAIQEIMD